MENILRWINLGNYLIRSTTYKRRITRGETLNGTRGNIFAEKILN